MIRHAPSIGLGLGLSLRGGGVGFQGLLDLYPGAAAAYSLQALSSSWVAGDVVEVRRSSDSATQGFTQGQIDSGAMLEFVNGGTTDLYNSALYFNESNTQLSSSTLGSFYADNDIFEIEFTVYAKQLSGDGFVFSIGDDANNGIHFVYQLSTGRALCEFIVGGVNVKTFRPWEDGTYKITANKTLGTFSVVNPDQSISNSASSFQSFGKNGNGELNVGFRYAVGGRTLNGTVTDITLRDETLTDVLHWSGLGTSVTAWQDTIGSNDGTEVNGAAYTGQPFDGYVSKWYDQSGNANDATQATTTAQPKIVDAGALVAGGIDFDGVDDFMKLGDLGLSQPNSVVFVHNSDTDGGTNTLKNDFLDGTSASTGRTLIDYDGTVYRIFAGVSEDTSKTLVANQDALVFVTLNDGSSEFSLDGSNETGLTAGTNGMDEMTLGASISGGRYDGTFAEFIIYNSDQSANREGIETNINNRYNIFIPHDAWNDSKSWDDSGTWNE